MNNNPHLKSRLDDIIIELHDIAREYRSPDLRKVADDLSRIKNDMKNKEHVYDNDTRTTM